MLFRAWFFGAVLVASKSPSRVPKASKSVPRAAKRLPRGPKDPPGAPQEAPRFPQERPKRLQEVPKRSQDPPKSTTGASKRSPWVPRVLQRCYLGFLAGVIRLIKKNKEGTRRDALGALGPRDGWRNGPRGRSPCLALRAAWPSALRCHGPSHQRGETVGTSVRLQFRSTRFP